MHIVLTHTDFPLYWIPRIRILNRALRKNGHELTVISVTAKPSIYNFADTTKSIDNISWINLFENKDIFSLTYKHIAAAIFQKLEEVKPDMVVAVAIAFPPGTVAIRWSKMRKRPVIIMDDVRQVDVPRPWWINFVKRQIYQNVDAMLIPAPSHRPCYIEWGVSEGKIFYGVDVVDNLFFAENTEKHKWHIDSMRNNHKLVSPFFLGVGRQIPKRNWMTLIKAFDLYRQADTKEPWDLVLIGDGPEHQNLENYVTEHGIKGIHFRPFCDPHTLCEYFSIASALILPSYGETWGLIVNEAMAAGLPVLVSKACGCAETLVHEGENGWTFPPDAPDELSTILIKHSNIDENIRREMGERSKEIISDWPLERFTYGLMEAIDACKNSKNDFKSLLSKFILNHWNGRLRST